MVYVVLGNEFRASWAIFPDSSWSHFNREIRVSFSPGCSEAKYALMESYVSSSENLPISRGRWSQSVRAWLSSGLYPPQCWKRCWAHSPYASLRKVWPEAIVSLYRRRTTSTVQNKILNLIKTKRFLFFFQLFDNLVARFPSQSFVNGIICRNVTRSEMPAGPEGINRWQVTTLRRQPVSCHTWALQQNSY